jgi:predicted MFS family arabinose efflux permease
LSGIPARELRVVALVTLLQFINIMDFMMVMPLGPDFALALGMDMSHVGIVAGSYTLAAALVALFGARYLDRFDRRPALAIAIAGLSVATLAAALAWDLYSLVAARMAAGFFGGPATSLALSSMIDVVPPERRGRAMAIVMASFSAASVLGVPFGLELARWFGWQAPFIAVGSAGLVLAALSFRWLPRLRDHLEGPAATDTLTRFLWRPVVRESLAVVALTMFGAFLLIPHLSAYFQFNMDYPRERIGLLYLVGGAVSFVLMQLAGRSIDRRISARENHHGRKNRRQGPGQVPLHRRPLEDQTDRQRSHRPVLLRQLQRQSRGFGRGRPAHQTVRRRSLGKGQLQSRRGQIGRSGLITAKVILTQQQARPL